MHWWHLKVEMLLVPTRLSVLSKLVGYLIRKRRSYRKISSSSGKLETYQPI